MPAQPTDFQPQHRLYGVAATIAVHLLLIGGWLLTRQASVDGTGAPAEAIQWVDVKPPEARAARAPQAVAPARKEPVARRVIAAPAAPQVQAVVSAPAPEPAAPTPAARSVDDMLQQARRDLGKIDKDLKKEFPQRGIRAPIDTAQKRLVKGIELANELAPRKWYEPTKITEVIDPSGEGRRRYRVITAGGTYCMTYDGVGTPNGRDHGTQPSTPKMTNCPPDEEPAKAQAW
jgi:hypothetical protein